MSERLSSSAEIIPVSRTGFVPRCDVVVDCAAYGNRYDQKDEGEIYTANVMRLASMLRCVNKYQYRAFIVTSTSSVLLPHQTFYSASKKAAEEMALIWARDNNKPIAAVRPASITGPGEQEEHLIPKLIRAAYTGEEIPFVPEPTHDFIHIDDYVNGVICVIDNIEKAKGKAYNVSSGVSVSNETVLDLVRHATGRSIRTRTIENMRPYDTPDWVVDNSDLRALGWQPKHSLYDTIKQMVEEYERENT